LTGEDLSEASKQLACGKQFYPLLGHPASREVLGVVGEQDVGICGEGDSKDVTVSNIHLNSFDDVEIVRVDLHERVLDVVVH
jgi:hypothetical protein